MSALDVVHGKYIFGRRVQRLAAALSRVFPTNATVLDVGCGDGSIAAEVLGLRPDLSITGADVLVRPDTKIPVQEYDGETLPYDDGSFDAVCMIDVLHHTDDPAHVLAEASRVARRVVVIKDHLTDGALAWPTLRLMDWVGNARHGVRLPYNYLSEGEWRSMFAAGDLPVQSWDEHLALYAPPLTWVFDRRLHMIVAVDASR
jgi:ubiquinone/menaquinone biosynthesis C-methylase UbiE